MTQNNKTNRGSAKPYSLDFFVKEVLVHLRRMAALTSECPDSGKTALTVSASKEITEEKTQVENIS